MIEKIKEIISQNNINPKIIFDIGSRDLEQSIEFKNSFPNAQVYAFEPNPEQEEYCKRKAKEYSIIFNNFALSDTEEEHNFFAIQKDGPNPNIGASALSYFSDEQLDYWNEVEPRSKPNVKEYQIKTITADNFCRINNIQNIDVMWIDVQGWELKVLNGAKETLNKTKLIHIELSFKKFYQETSLYPEVKKFLENQKFEEVWTNNIYKSEYSIFRNHLEIGLTDSIFIKT